MQAFERNNLILDRYVRQREILAPLSTPKLDDWPKYYRNLRDNACDIYHALEDGWRCRCPNPHIANLRLKLGPASLFNISLSVLSQDSQRKTAQMRWLEAKVDVDEPDEHIDSSSQCQGSNTTRSVGDSG